MNILETNVELNREPIVEEVEKPIYWESASIRENDNAIIIDINGQQRRVCRTVNPNYQNVLAQLRGTYPNLQPGVICKIMQYRDGRTEIVTNLL